MVLPPPGLFWESNENMHKKALHLLTAPAIYKCWLSLQWDLFGCSLSRGALLKSKTDPMLDTKSHLYQIIWESPSAPMLIFHLPLLAYLIEIHLDGSTLGARQQWLSKQAISDGLGPDAEHVGRHQPGSAQSPPSSPSSVSPLVQDCSPSCKDSAAQSVT